MKKRLQNIINSGSCPSIDQLILYHFGKLPRDENFAVENHLVECEICNEVLEGLSILNSNVALEAAEKEIKQRIHNLLATKNSKDKKLIIYRSLAIAASLLLFLTIPYLIYQSGKRTQHAIVQDVPKKTSPKYKELDRIQAEEKNLEDNKKGKSRIAVNKRMTVSKPMAIISIPKKYLNENEDKAIQPISTITDTIKFEAIAENIGFAQTTGSGKSGEKKLLIEYEKASEKEPRIITGRVTDQLGMAMIGVNVYLKGTSHQVATDTNGKFSITIDHPDDELVFTSIGYKQENITPANKDTLLIALKEDVVSLNEVIVLGYGVQKKSDLTSAVSSVSENDISIKPVMRVEQALQGRAAGVSVHKKSGFRTKFSSKNDSIRIHSLDSLKSLAIVQIELQNKQSAIDKLNDFHEQITDSILKKDIEEIINLVRMEKFEKALKKLKKISIN
jgi:hypothetical protein